MEKINKTKNWLFEELNKIDNTQDDWLKKKEMTQITKIRNER